MKRVLLFGTSANPPTGMGGHAGIVSWGAARDDVDEIWVLPVYRHAFEEKRDMPSFEHRMAMAKLAFEPLSSKVKVLDVERELADPKQLIGTIDVVRHLMQKHPEVSFGLLMGADTYRDLMSGRWKESDRLKRSVRLVPISRKGVDETLGGPDLEEVSSTDCRRTDDEAELLRVLSPEVVAYMRDHRLYAFGVDPTDAPVR